MKATIMDRLASMPMPAIRYETTDELIHGRTSHCFDAITDTVIGYPESYRREKAAELTAICAELVRRGVITGTPKVIADALARYA